MKRLVACGWLAVLATVLGTTSVRAADDCLVFASTFSFGTYDGVNDTPGTMTLTIDCSHGGGSPKTFNYNLKLSKGPGGYAARRMAGSTGDTLFYIMYTTGAYTTIWGDGSGGTSVVS